MAQHKRSTNPDFQARHYVKIATLLGEVAGQNTDISTVFEGLVSDFSTMFAEDNPNYNHTRFVEFFRKVRSEEANKVERATSD